MASNDYHFVTHWRVQAPIQEVVDILSDAESLPRWWPSVYLEVRELRKGDSSGIGKRIALHTKGWLPYTLRWQFDVTESNPPHGFTLVANGDFVGRGIWTFEADGEWVNITYDWLIVAEKPLLKYLSLVMKPLFSMNHHWAMERGEESLRLELARRHATSRRFETVATPPPATPSHPLRWLAFVVSGR
ncbi:MAG: SRPBCC family protein [Anaerolineae bacterium]|nr:SRPBCC family protein [Anaerolineae bacterium]